jgi:hypothetical protein
MPGNLVKVWVCTFSERYYGYDVAAYAVVELTHHAVALFAYQ